MTDMRSSDEGTIFEVNPVTGDRTIISSAVAGNTVGTGPGLFFATRLAVGPDGSIFTPNISPTPANYILSTDPLTGNRTIISDATHGTGPAFGLSVSSGIMVVPNVPEPSTFILAAIGGLALFAHRWRCP